MRDPAEWPVGIVTFLLTDIEGSTRLWEEHGDAVAPVIARHRTIIADAVAACGGTLVRERGEGDSTFSVFEDASAALAAALRIQLGLRREGWPEGMPIRVRAAMRTGEVAVVEGDYTSTVINRCARLRDAAHGGQTLVAATTADAATLPPDATLVDLGPHRLRDLPTAEPIHELRHAELEGDFPPLRAVDVLPHNLPAELTEVLGRDRESARIGRLLGDHRLVTLVGAPGVGKTRLAVHVGTRDLAHYRGGVWLADVARPGGALDAVSAAVGAIERPGATPLESLVDRLRGAPVLLVLDSCEADLDGAARVAQAVLDACPETRVLATSREAMSIPGEAALRIEPLPVPSDDDPPEAASGNPAVQLLASGADLDPDADPARVEALADIARRLDGIPLALELAAPHVSRLGAVTVADRLGDRFALLVGRGEGRHRTLRAAVDWGHELLDEPDQLVLRRLGVFAGGFDLPAAEPVVAEGALDVAAAMSRLVAASFVEATPSGLDVRFHLLDTIRDYALGRLRDAGEERAIRDRHLHSVLVFTERAPSALEGPEQAAWLEALDEQHADVVAALDHAAATQPVRALELASRVWRYWFVRGRWTEGLRRLEPVLGSEGNPAHRAEALIGAGGLSQCLGDLDRAEERYREASGIQRALGDEVGEATTWGMLGQLHGLRGEMDRALALLSRSVDALRHHGDRVQLTSALLALGSAERRSDPSTDGVPRFEEALSLARYLGNRRLEGRAHFSLASAAFGEHRLAEAEEHVTAAIAIGRVLGDHPVLAHALYLGGLVAEVTGDDPMASSRLAEAADLFDELDASGPAAEARARLSQVRAET